MAKYAYTALDASRNAVRGELDVKEQKDLTQFFIARKLTPISIRKNHFAIFKEVFFGLVRRWHRKLLINELIVFTRQFAAAYGAGVPLGKILSITGTQITHKEFKAAVEGIGTKIQEGKSLSEAFGAYDYIFDDTYRAILQSGELTGNLDTVLNYCAGILEKRQKHAEKISSTLLYPKIVVSTIVVTVIVVLVFVIPKFKAIFDKFGSQLPLPTRIMMDVSDIFTEYWWAFAMTIPLWIVLTEFLKRNEKFMLGFHEIMSKVPVFGNLIVKLELAHFCTTFALLLRAGIQVTQAINTATNAMSNRYFRKQFSTVVPRIEQGATLSKSMEGVKVVPPIMSSMIAIGEESGTIDTLLDKVAQTYDSEAEVLLTKVPTYLEPVILSILFGVVLFVALAVYLPMWKMASLLKN